MALALLVLSSCLLQAELPEIKEVIPRTARARDLIRIVGRNFQAEPTNNAIYIAAARATVRESSANELIVEVPRAIQPGPITVVAGGKARTYSGYFHGVYETYRKGIATYRVGPRIGATAMRFADLDSDGDLEVVTIEGNRVWIRDHIDTGTIGGYRPFSAFSLQRPTYQTALDVFDMDSDGRLDLVLWSGSSLGQITTILNVHVGGPLTTNSFAQPVQTAFYSFVGETPQFGDIDADGRIDAVHQKGAEIHWYRNLYNGGTNIFGSGMKIGEVGTLGSYRLADLNSDGFEDLLVIQATRLQLFVHKGVDASTNAVFHPEFEIPIAGTFVQFVDVESDGRLDIEFDVGGRCQILWNRNNDETMGPGDFQMVEIPISGAGGNGLCELNGDGVPDIIVNGGVNINGSEARPGVSPAEMFSGASRFRLHLFNRFRL